MRFEVLAGDAVRSDWARLNIRTPFASPGFFDAWCAAFPERDGCVIAGYRDDALQLVLPIWRAHDAWHGLGEFRADYTDAAGDGADALWAWLADGAPCRMIKLTRIQADSPLGRCAPRSNGTRARIVNVATSFVRRRGRARYHDTREHTEHPYADRAHIERLADRIDSKETRRKINMLKRHGELAYKVVRGRDVLTLLPAFFEMHRAGFAGTNRTSQFVDANERRFYEALVEHLADVVTMDVLSSGDRYIAMHFGFEHAGCIYWYKPAFDLELAKGSPGRVMLAHLFARAARDGIHTVDLLKGDEPYKDEWANQRRRTITTTIVERSLRGLVDLVRRHLTRVRISESLPRS